MKNTEPEVCYASEQFQILVGKARSPAISGKGSGEAFSRQGLSQDFILLETIYEDRDLSGKQCHEGLLGGHGHCTCTPCLLGDSKQRPAKLSFLEKKRKMIHSLNENDMRVAYLPIGTQKY